MYNKQIDNLPEATIDQRFRKLRKQKGFNQLDVALELGKSQNTYGKYEQGINLPDIDVIIRLSKLYGVTTDYLLTGKKASVSQQITELIDSLPESKQEKVLDVVKSILQL